eukprot:Tamp_20365.p5 GENE.Tamp_20365~~Tamp_20365.p5  ORF type:complete len:102 (-),score=23.49 Tamp_20365:341-646(-)
MVSVPCKLCRGDGVVQREMPSKVPLTRLEGGVTGFVQREKTCPDCGGFGTCTEEKSHYDDETGAVQDPPKTRVVTRTVCYRCQANSDELCTCDKPMRSVFE